MNESIFKELTEHMQVSPGILRMVMDAESQLADEFAALEDLCFYNQLKILRAYKKNRLSDRHFSWHTGYGYDDPGREITEKIFADVFGTEAALVRTQIVNGTHALSLVFQGILRPGDEMIYTTGKPYDTLEETVGLRGQGHGGLADFGIVYKQVDLKEDGHINIPAVLEALTPKTRMVCVQRATGYAWRKAITVDEIAQVVQAVKAVRPDIIMMTDNCYGEFLDTKEPPEVGVDIIAGSLIKNPGGGLALSGGYVAGRADLIDLVARRLTTPGIGGECGLTFGQTRTMLQGLFMGPSVVKGAIKGAMLLGLTCANMGYPVCPAPGDKRSDIIQAVQLGSPEAVISFCKGVQSASPVDAFVDPEPWDMPGYGDQVIMAAGAFVQGSSIELSADAPIREPYTVYFQGGLTYEHSRYGVICALQRMAEDGLLRV